MPSRSSVSARPKTDITSPPPDLTVPRHDKTLLLRRRSSRLESPTEQVATVEVPRLLHHRRHPGGGGHRFCRPRRRARLRPRPARPHATASVPFNTTGGLIGWGHPTGATGVHQAVTIWEQLTGRAGNAQISIPEDRPFGLTINMGGDDKTLVSVVYKRG
ncbi:MAG: hypothetical protein MZV63_41450 [Marinilabiliales bacterium]|nr:hypothetical protein [Marinilabiliales bacterium]